MAEVVEVMRIIDLCHQHLLNSGVKSLLVNSCSMRGVNTHYFGFGVNVNLWVVEGRPSVLGHNFCDVWILDDSVTVRWDVNDDIRDYVFSIHDPDCFDRLLTCVKACLVELGEI